MDIQKIREIFHQFLGLCHAQLQYVISHCHIQLLFKQTAEGMGTMIMLCFPWKMSDNMSDAMEEERTKKEEQDVPDPISR